MTKRFFSAASTLIKDMLTVRSSQRANIEMICSHWWVNEGYERNCLDLAKDLVNQSPVKLNLLLSIVPQTVNTEKTVTDNSKYLTFNKAIRKKPREILTPIRCYSTGSIIDLGSCTSNKMQEIFIKKLPKKNAITTSKKKLQTTYSADEPQNLYNQKEQNEILSGLE